MVKRSIREFFQKSKSREMDVLGQRFFRKAEHRSSGAVRKKREEEEGGGMGLYR